MAGFFLQEFGGMSGSGLPSVLSNLVSSNRKSDSDVYKMIQREIDVKTNSALISKNINILTLKYKDAQTEKKVQDVVIFHTYK